MQVHVLYKKPRKPSVLHVTRTVFPHLAPSWWLGLEQEWAVAIYPLQKGLPRDRRNYQG